MYETRPKIHINNINVFQGEEEIVNAILNSLRQRSGNTVALECYPGLDEKKIVSMFQKVNDKISYYITSDYYQSSDVITKELSRTLTDDRVFGRFSHDTFMNFINGEKFKRFQQMVSRSDEIVFLVGVGASEMLQADIVVYCNLTKWDIQKSFRNGSTNWKSTKSDDDWLKKIKRAYYFEWPAANELKKKVIIDSNYVIDCTNINNLKMIRGTDYLTSLNKLTQIPFRLVPYFDPGVWGGHWMQKKFMIDQDKINLAWSFDGVPEENSILFDFSGIEFEFPADDLLLIYPEKILGSRVYGRYGSDFPIRFDYLDTMGGGNLSLQVHPTLDYAYRKFGLKYTQDESYYIMDCLEDSYIYLGLKEGVDKDEFISALEESERTGVFNVDRYINKLPVKPHDHFLIPAGTIHCSGKNCVVLEISSTPNRFTFKLWDWGRKGLDGKPRPIHINHGKNVINFDMKTSKVLSELVNNITKIYCGTDYIEERTGLHTLEPIETRRHIFNNTVIHENHDSVNMLNLVKGDQISVESLDNSFDKVIINYGETFIIPHTIKKYKITPLTKGEYITMKAFIR